MIKWLYADATAIEIAEWQALNHAAHVAANARQEAVAQLHRMKFETDMMFIGKAYGSSGWMKQVIDNHKKIHIL